MNHIPDKAMSAAMTAMETVTPPPGVDKSEWLNKYGPYALLAGAIAAAAPFIAAQAWEEGSQAGYAEHASEDAIQFYEPAKNPYKP